MVLVAPRNPLNIGAAARAMANFGFTRLRVVNPYEVAFREARSAVGAAPLLASAEEFTTVADAVADCALVVGTTSVGHRELQHPLRRLEYGARLIAQSGRTRRIAFRIGEVRALERRHEPLPLVDAHPHGGPESFDEPGPGGGGVPLRTGARCARGGRAARKQKPAGAADTEQITAMLVEALERSGYIKPLTAESTKAKVRRLVRRLNLTARDAPVVLGMLRQILWKLGSP